MTMNIFNLFGKKNNNVIPFPEIKSSVPQPEENTPATVYYRIGVTDNNRVSLQVGYSEITMNKEGVQNLIEQLTLFMDQLRDDNNDDAS